MKNDRILVLGGSGFIGSRLVPELIRHNAKSDIVAWSGEHDIRNASVISEIERIRPSLIIMAAGKSFVPESWINPLDFYTVNTTGTMHVAEAARKCNSRLVFLSTFVYGEPYQLPISETNSTATFNPYASSKLAGERILEDYFRHFGIESNVLRVFNIYGPGQRPDFLIPSIISQAKTGVVKVKDLKPRRDYLYVKDLISAILAATTKFDGFNVFNVASGISHSVQEVIDLVAAIGETKLEIIAENESRPNEVGDTRASISKIKTVLNWEPHYSLKDGLKETMHFAGINL